MNRRTCSRCRESKALSEFAGSSGYCKPCAKQYRKEYDATEHGKRKNRNRLLMHRFGITLEQYEAMHADQKGLCACCGQPETALSNVNGEKLLAVHHNHQTGVVEALLCQRCNIGIGHFGDDPDALMQAAAFLLARQNETQTAITG